MINTFQGKETREKGICIGGGVGPMAGVELHRKIIEHTRTDGTDQSHIDIIHLSRSSVIGDRTEFLLGRTDSNPAHPMAETVLLALKSFESIGKGAVIGIPCNTFHAPEIFGPFYQLVKGGYEKETQAIRGKIPGPVIINMLAETIGYMKNRFPRIRTIGLLSTTGTRQSGVWYTLLEHNGYSVVEVSDREQETVHTAIYDIHYGLKALSPASEKAKGMMENSADILLEKGADAILTGCTELPLALPGYFYREKPLIDPVSALARALVAEAAPGKLKPSALD